MNLLSTLILLNLLLPSMVLAHFPVFLKKDPELDSPQTLKRPYEKSIAVYTYFAKENDLDVYEFELTDKDLINGPVDILVGTLVPSCKPLRNLLISWVITGPSQASLFETPEAEIAKRIQFKEGQGALVVKNEEQGDVWYEKYTRHYYFYQKRESLAIRVPGTYRVFVWSNDGAKGDYVFEFGNEEMWGFRDIMYTFWVYPKLLLEKEIMTPNCKTSNLKNAHKEILH